MQQFGQHWDSTIDPANLSDHFYLDIGKETCLTGMLQQQYYTALQGSYIKVFGLCKEYQYNLYQSCLPGVLSGQEPFYSLPTLTLLFWIYWNVNKFCVGFKIVYSLNNYHFVTWEYTWFLYTGGLVQRVSGCWQDIWFRPDRQIKEYRYAWFLDKLNWDIITFCQPSVQYMMFNSPSMQTVYRAQYAQMEEFSSVFPCLDLLQDFLRQLALCVFRKD
ncbi:hypothetical protein BDW62DRAFT_196343, partial [Aspergillus aurantiobrunneus]